MAYPNPPEIATNYSAQEQALGDGSLPGQELDVDLAAIRASATATIEFLKGITRSDGKLANGIVTKESLASSLIIGFDPPALWASGTAYTTSSTVFEGFGFYLCVTPHTSTVFNDDFASGRWALLADLTPPGGALIASNNLSDLGDAANARANLGLGSMATASASAYRTNVENDLVYQAILTGLTASVAELNKLTGVTATATELNRVAGVTSPIQTQLNTLNSGKQAQDAFLDDIAALTDPGGRRVLGWDDTADEIFWLQPNYTWSGPVATNGAAVYDFGSIPSWVTEIVILLNAVSLTTKTDNIQIRIGTGGTPETTGYTCTTSSIENTATTTNDGAASFFAAASLSSYVGVCHLYKEPTSNTWMFSGKGRRTGSGGATNFVIDGLLGLSGALDIVRLTRNGASNFNGGFCSVGYR